MAHTVNTGWRKVTPGPCPQCGMSGDYGCDGRGTVLCSCNEAFDESFDTTEADGSEPSENQTHWGYGSGMVGCLYDNGPHFVRHKRDAIDGALLPFIDTLTDAEEKTARAELARDGIHYFPGKRRAEIGADYCEIVEQQGPCPESDE